MIQVTGQMRVLVAVEPADFRRGIDGLARLCREELGSDPFSGTAFVFRNRRKMMSGAISLSATSTPALPSVTSSPPLSTNSCRRASPSKPIPQVMSSDESSTPWEGSASVRVYGIGLHFGSVPCTTDFKPAGAQPAQERRLLPSPSRSGRAAGEPPSYGRLHRRHGMKHALRSAGPGLLAGLLAGLGQAQETERVSVASDGTEGNGASFSPSISEDGRYMAFDSAASNLVPGDTNGHEDVFVRDRVAGTTERVSAATDGTQGNGWSGSPSGSADGRYVAFESRASNLFPGDANDSTDVFVRDRVAGTTELVSVATNGVPGNGGSHGPSISPDGRYVAFWSSASNLVLDDTNGASDIFVRDRVTRTTERVSVASNGTQGNGSSLSGSISPDGRYVAFVSWATNLAPGDTNGHRDVFVRDRLAGATERVSVATDGTQGDSWSEAPSISADGRYVAFSSFASNLAPGDTNGYEDVFVRDRVAGTTERVSIAADGTQGNGPSYMTSISANGRYVAFVGIASNLVPGDTNDSRDVFVRDRMTGTTERVSVAVDGTQGNDTSQSPSMSADGRQLGFNSFANNLVPGDTNGVPDVFVRDGGAPPPSPFCSGDGSGAPCPCGNTGDPDHGCGNGSFPSGCGLSAFGNASVGADTLVLSVASSTPGRPGLFFQGDNAINGGSGTPFGDGLRCAGGNAVRLQVRVADGGGSASTTIGIAAAGGVSAGDVKRYQWWYRDPAGSPCLTGFNLSNGLELTWAP